MTILGEAFIAIRPQAKSFEAELQKDVVPGAQRVAKTLATAIGGAFVAGKIKDFVKGGLDELKEAAAVQGQTAAAIKSTGAAANVTEAQVGKLSGQLLKLSGTDDELIQKGANLLLTFTGVRNEVGKGNDIFNQATKAALDLSVAGFGSVESASVLMGKALNDPVQGLTALQRVGVRLTDDQKELVRQLVATGDTLGAQKVILEEVNKQVGGSAEAYGNTLPGKIAIAQQSMENLKGTMVSSLAPALEVTAGFATSFAEQFAKQPEILQQVEGGLLVVVGGLASIITPLKSGIDLWRSFGAGAQAASGASGIGGLASAATNSAGAVDTLYTKSTRLSRLGFGGMATSAASVVTQLGLIAGAIALTNDAADRASLPKLSQDILTFAESGKAGAEFTSTFGSDLDQLGRSVERIAAPSGLTQAENVIDAFGRALGDTDDDLSNARAHVDDLDKALANIAAQDPETAAAALKSITDAMDPETARRLVGLLNDYDDAVATAGVSSKITAGQIGSTGDAASDAAGSVDDLAGATTDLTGEQKKTETAAQKVRTALDEQRVALDELLGTTRSAIDTELDYRDAQDASEDSLAALTQLIKDGKGGTEEYTRAVDDAARVLLRQSEAAADTATKQAELAGKTLSTNDQVRIQQTELRNLADKMSPGSPLRRQLEGFIFTLGQVNSRHVEVTANTRQAQEQLDAVLARLKVLVDIGLGDSADAAQLEKWANGPRTIGSARGGLVPRYAALGGFPGDPRGTDTVPAWLTPGEFVMQRSAVDRLGVGLLSALNQGMTPDRQRDEGFTVGQLVVQGATVEGAYATASEVTRQLRAEHFRLTGVT